MKKPKKNKIFFMIDPIKRRKKSLMILIMFTLFFPIAPNVLSWFYPEVKSDFDMEVVRGLCFPYLLCLFIVILVYCFFVCGKKKSVISLFYLDLIMLTYFFLFWFVFGTIDTAYQFRHVPGISLYILGAHSLVFTISLLSSFLYVKEKCLMNIERNTSIWNFDTIQYSDNAFPILEAKQDSKRSFVLPIYILVLIFLFCIANQFYPEFFDEINWKLVEPLFIFSFLNFSFLGYFLPWKAFQIYYVKRRLKENAKNMLVKELVGR